MSNAVTLKSSQLGLDSRTLPVQKIYVRKGTQSRFVIPINTLRLLVLGLSKRIIVIISILKYTNYDYNAYDTNERKVFIGMTNRIWVPSRT